MSYNNYAISILGKEKWNELVRKYNLCTKKWTLGRTKEFYKEVDKEIKAKLNTPKEVKKYSLINKLLNKFIRRK